MNTYDWYKIINKTEFEATGLISREVSVILEGVGTKSFLVTKANYLAITVDEVFLPLGVKPDSIFEFEERAIYLDANQDVWYGIKVS